MSEPSALIEELRELAATLDNEWSDQEWWVESRFGSILGVWGFLREDDSDPAADAVDVLDEPSKATAAFIARSRSAIPELCDALESALRERDEARALLAETAFYIGYYQALQAETNPAASALAGDDMERVRAALGGSQ